MLQIKADHQSSKFQMTDFRWTRPYIFKKALRITITWYARLERTNWKLLLACDYDQWHQKFLCPMLGLRRNRGNLTLKFSLIMMICKPVHGSPLLESSLLPRILKKRAHLTQAKWWWKLIPQRPEHVAHQKAHEKDPQKFFSRQTDHVTERILIPPLTQVRKWVRINPVEFQPTSAVGKTI